jgi:regulator of protease activity HflC (stomatin/prohibitin superfamily)
VAVIIVVIVLALMLLANMFRVLREYERAVIFRLGRLVRVRTVDGERADKGPGLIILIPFKVENFLFATSQLAQTTLRSILGQAELDEVLAQREKINDALQKIIDSQTEPWGIKVAAVEVKHVDLPTEMQRAMARQAEAERERRAKVIHADGELQAATKLSEAARQLSIDPAAIQLRYLQTLAEVAAETNSTTIFPMPIDFFKIFLSRNEN